MHQPSSAQSDRWQALQRVLDAALDASPAERGAVLRAACGDDVELRREAEEVLATGETDGGLLDIPAAEYAAPLLGELFPTAGVLPAGAEVGEYRVVRELAHGGMGTVYVAERRDGAPGQVALKLVRPGMESERLIRRFAAERRILGSMDHPDIARLLDGGVTATGVPYLVMELVDGEPIDRYCDARRLGIAARLALFVRVCGAVGYAHANRVIHRDLKPSNILVTADGGLRLLDFGIAKLIADTPGELDLITTANFRPMTPEFASPEQLRGDVVTMSSDIYALGILLSILLSGHHPYRVFGLHRSELTRIVLQQEPEPPSRSLSRIGDASVSGGEELTPEGVAASRGTTVDQLRRDLEGSLDAIVVRALGKDPAQRYPSVVDLAEDVHRHLDRASRPPSRSLLRRLFG